MSICIFRELAWRIAQGEDGHTFFEGRQEGNCDCLKIQCAMWEENTGKCGFIAQAYLKGWEIAQMERNEMMCNADNGIAIIMLVTGTICVLFNVAASIFWGMNICIAFLGILLGLTFAGIASKELHDNRGNK